ncbi:RNA-directed DNA polymerase, eukaryota, reverse transcriptase zinc-binding domain protein [Tanacetum coccineum]
MGTTKARLIDVIKTELPKSEEHNFGRKLLSHKKNCLLKARFKQWHSETKTSDRVTKHDNLQLIKSIEEKIEAGYANDDDCDSRIKLLHEVDKLDTFESFDLFQKAHIKWDIEEKLKNHDSNMDLPPFAISSGLCALDRGSLETLVTLDEVKNAVWDCGSSKDPGPDGFSFAFVKKYWDDIKVDILEYVNIFLGTSSLPHGSNSSFFTRILKVSNPVFIKYFHPISLIGIHYKIISKILANSLAKVIDKIVSHEQSTFIVGRQILDGPLILSEIVEWFKKKLLIFKVDFEKTFDSMSWKYLDFVLFNLGFVSKWRSWIRACLSLSRASILVNGSPTSEFSINRSLRQGDPLSSFLFILVIEGLHNALSTIVSSGLIIGVKFGSLELTISHLFYVDDTSISLLWPVLLDKFQSKLSLWKANILSIGGRHALIKVVLGSLGKGIRVYKFNLVYVANIKWVVELPFNVHMLSSTSTCSPLLDQEDQSVILSSFHLHVWHLQLWLLPLFSFRIQPGTCVVSSSESILVLTSSPSFEDMAFLPLSFLICPPQVEMSLFVDIEEEIAFELL